MDLVLKLNLVSLVLLICAFGSKAVSYRRLRSTVCYVANIRSHTSEISWWWHPQRSSPVISARKPRSHAFHNNWMVFRSDMQHHITKISVMEIAHRVNSHQCRFLLHSQPGRNSIRFSRPTLCRPGLNGIHGLFSTSREALTDQPVIAAGPRPVSDEESLFLGVSSRNGRSLALTSIRNSRSMRWWDIKILQSRSC